MVKAIPKELINRIDFAWRLRVLMAMADIRPQELAGKSGMSLQHVYKIRAGEKHPDLEEREILLSSIEKWKPGTLAMMMAAEQKKK